MRTSHFICATMIFLMSGNVVFQGSCYGDEPERYYSFETDLGRTKFSFPEKNDMFSKVMELSEKSGTVYVKLFVHGNQSVECNLKFNIGDINNVRSNISHCFSAYRSVGIEELNNSTEELPSRISGLNLMVDDLLGSKPISFLKREKFLLLLKKDEFFAMSIDIWNINIWDELSNVLCKYPAEEYKMSFQLLLKIEGVFYSVRPSCIITAKEVEFYNKLKDHLNKKEDSEDKPMSAPCQMIVFNENGDIEVSISPVEKTSYFTINLTEVFGDDKKFFNNRFALNHLDANEKHFEESIDSDKQSEAETDGRMIDIGFGEKIGKSSKIWDISIWPEICSQLRKNRTNKYRISYPVHVILDGKPVEYEAFFEIDNRTMNHMERLKRTTEKNSDKLPVISM